MVATEPMTARGRASRERIVAGVAEVVAEHGVRAVSLEQVLAAAGASKSQLYHYFGGRDQLMEAAVGYRCDQVLGGLTEAFAAVATMDDLERTLAGFVAQYEQSPSGCPIGSLASDVAEHHEEGSRAGRGRLRGLGGPVRRGVRTDAGERRAAGGILARGPWHRAAGKLRAGCC